MIRAICSLVAIASVGSAQTTTSVPLSPCPDVFTYDPPGASEKPGAGIGKWFGTVTLSSDITLYALWLNIILDSKADILGNWVGEVTTEDNHNFKIENTKLKITRDTPLAVRFFVQYNIHDNVPSLQSILFNGREICNVDTDHAIVINPVSTSDNYDFSNGIHSRVDKAATTVRSITTTKTKNQYGQLTTLKPNYWTQPNVEPTEATTEKSRTKYETDKSENKAPLNSNIWSWAQPNNENIQKAKTAANLQSKNKEQTQVNSGSNSQSKPQWPQNKSENNQQTVSSVTKNVNQAQANQDIRQQSTTSQVWPQTKGYQQTKSEKLQVTTERNAQATFGSTSYSQPQTWSAGKVENNQQVTTENKNQASGDKSMFQLWSQVKVDNTGQIKPDNKQSSQSSYTGIQSTTENAYNKVQVWSPTKAEDNQQTKPTNNQGRTEERYQVSTANQYYSQINGETNQQTKNGLGTSFEDISYVESQNTQIRKSGGVYNTGQYDISGLQKKVSTDSFQITGTRQQVRPVESDQIRHEDAIPIRDDDILQGRPKNRKGAATTPPRPSTTYSYTQDERKVVIEYAGSRDTNERGEVNDRNVHHQSPLSGHQQITERPHSHTASAPIVNDYYNDNVSKEDDEDESSGLGLPILYIPNVGPEPTCGKVTKKPPQYLRGGSTTSEGQWPWQAALYQQQTVDFKYICGGTLVSHRHIITAAHCVTRKMSRRKVNQNTLTVYLGKFNLRTSIDGVQVKFVHRIIIHPEYNATIFSRDLAILELREAATFTDWVRPVCLWPENEIGRRYVVGKKGSVVGWGFEMSGAPRAELSLLEMPVVDQETCISSFIDFYQKFISEYTYCAGYNDGTSVCNGDSGGGMVFKKGNTWHLRGIASLSVARPNEYSCDPKRYVIFTDLAKFLPWIEEHID